MATCTIGALNFVMRSGVFFFNRAFAGGVVVAAFKAFNCRIAVGGGVVPLLASVALDYLRFSFKFFPANNYTINRPGFCL
jgi:hypothetical protein